MNATILIPSKLSEITLKRYQEFAKVVADGAEGEFLNQKMVSIFCEIPLKNVALIKRMDLLDIVDHLNGLFDSVKDFKQTFTFDSKQSKIEFGFIPSLEDITMDEYTDLDTYIVNWEDMHRAMAVMFRPITTKIKDKYLIQEYNGTDDMCELMKYAPMDVVLSARLFFWTLGSELVKSTHSYLKEEIISEMLEEETSQTSTSRGDGTQVFTHLQREILDTLTNADNFQFPKPLHF